MLIRMPPPPGTGQRNRIEQRLRPASCVEVDCALLRHGRLFLQVVAPHVGRAATTRSYDPVTGLAEILHPAGAACGPACPNEYCPCAPAGMIPGAGGYPHYVADDRYPIAFGIDGRRVSAGEALDRFGEGTAALALIRTRGL